MYDVSVLFFLIHRRPPISTLFPYTTLFRAVPPGHSSWVNSIGQFSIPTRTPASSATRMTSGQTSATPGQLSGPDLRGSRSEEHTSELQSRQYLVSRLLLEQKNDIRARPDPT